MNWETALINPHRPSVDDLKPSDRCDAQCSAQARVRVVLSNSGVLDFCVHHFGEHEVALAAQGARVHQMLRVQLQQEGQ